MRLLSTAIRKDDLGDETVGVAREPGAAEDRNMVSGLVGGPEGSRTEQVRTVGDEGQ